MPYIKSDVRKRIDAILNLDELKKITLSVGEMNYIITRIITSQVPAGGINYNYINDVAGVLDCASKEFNRRVAGPYEDKKIKENGDVY